MTRMTVVFKLNVLTVCILHMMLYDTCESQCINWYRAFYISENKLENICLKFSRFFGVCFFIYLQKMFTLPRQNWLCLVCVDSCP